MSLLSNVHERLVIDQHPFLVGEHPQAPGIPYGQEGRQGTVYLLQSETTKDKKAIKVFRSKFANPSMVLETEQLIKFSNMSGLLACERMIITPQQHSELVERHPELLYAVVMPWIEGPTWMDVLLNQQRLTRRESYNAAFAFTELMVTMEQRGLAHCDLSAPNVMLPMLSDIAQVRSSEYIQLIDLEQMYAKQFTRPQYVPGGSPGYAPRNKDRLDLWSLHSDRFAGAVLLMEMLGASTEEFMSNVWGESYFDPDEIQTSCDRYDILIEAIGSVWGEEFITLFERAWGSDDLAQCPTFGDWMVALTKIDPSVYREQKTTRQRSNQAVHKEVANQNPADNKLEQLLRQARECEEAGKEQEAIKIYRSLSLLNPHASLAKEVEIAIQQLELKLESAAAKQATTTSSIGRKVWKPILTILLLLVVASAGFFAYPFVNKNKIISPEILTATESELAETMKELDDTKLLMNQIHTQLEEMKKPLADRKKDLIENLNNHYHEVKSVAAYSVDSPNIEKQTFEAAEAYVLYVLEYMRLSFDLDPQFIPQFHVVSGYYYPYLYNDKRNAQLNQQFFKDYKDNF